MQQRKSINFKLDILQPSITPNQDRKIILFMVPAHIKIIGNEEANKAIDMPG